MDYELRLVPSDMPSLDKFQGNMNSICLQRVWRWRFGKASGGEDKLPLWLWDRRRPSAPLFELFCVGRTVAIIMWPVIGAPCKSLVSPPTEQIAQIGFLSQFIFWIFLVSFKLYGKAWWWGVEVDLRLLFMNRSTLHLESGNCWFKSETLQKPDIGNIWHRQVFGPVETKLCENLSVTNGYGWVGARDATTSKKTWQRMLRRN